MNKSQWTEARRLAAACAFFEDGRNAEGESSTKPSTVPDTNASNATQALKTPAVETLAVETPTPKKAL